MLDRSNPKYKHPYSGHNLVSVRYSLSDLHVLEKVGHDCACAAQMGSTFDVNSSGYYALRLALCVLGITVFVCDWCNKGRTRRSTEIQVSPKAGGKMGENRKNVFVLNMLFWLLVYVAFVTIVLFSLRLRGVCSVY